MISPSTEEMFSPILMTTYKANICVSTERYKPTSLNLAAQLPGGYKIPLTNGHKSQRDLEKFSNNPNALAIYRKIVHYIFYTPILNELNILDLPTSTSLDMLKPISYIKNIQV